MRNKLLVLLFCSLAFVSNAQTPDSVYLASATKVSVEKSIFGIQIGFLGIWINNEARLSNSFVLRSELGFAAQIWGLASKHPGYIMAPVITVEPRWYYNLKKRKSKSKRIDENSGNFLSLQTSFFPGGSAISNYVVNERAMISTILMWGIKRNIGKHFNSEVALGPEYVHTFPDKSESSSSDDYYLSFFLRIGYQF